MNWPFTFSRDMYCRWRAEEQKVMNLVLVLFNWRYPSAYLCNTKFTLFADDTDIFNSHENKNALIRLFSLEIPKVSNWFKINKLPRNINKTSFIHLTHTNTQTPDFPYNIVIDNGALERKKCTKKKYCYWWKSQLEWTHTTYNNSLHVWILMRLPWVIKKYYYYYYY